jgi:uncharacterized membrane protein YdfJ with MMPL/SSD domain
MSARAVVALRWPVIVGWLAALVAALALLPGLGGSSTAPLNDIVPSSAPALQAESRALQLFGATVATDVAVVQRNPRGLGRAEVTRTLRVAASLQGAARGGCPASARRRRWSTCPSRACAGVSAGRPR